MGTLSNWVLPGPCPDLLAEYGPEIPIKGTKVKSITLALEGAAAHCMVTLHNTNAPELKNFDHIDSAPLSI